MLLKKLLKLLYPNGYLQQAIGEQETAENINLNKETHENILLQNYLIPSIRWCDIKKDYVPSYRIPKGIK